MPNLGHPKARAALEATKLFTAGAAGATHQPPPAGEQFRITYIGRWA
jgi:hypothetical protein